jgi:hypothetical protein
LLARAACGKIPPHDQRPQPDRAEGHMLRFASQPDRVFLAILHSALELARDMISPFPPSYTLTPSESATAAEDYAGIFPRLAEFFDREDIVRLLDRLLEASRDPDTLYQLTDWCWLVLHECLEHFVAVHNDLGPSEVGPYRIGEIDFGAIVDVYFWDLDFLMGETLVDLGAFGREQMGVNPETFGIAAGLRPHPDEVHITSTEWETPDGKPFTPEGPEKGRIPRYPARVTEE